MEIPETPLTDQTEDAFHVEYSRRVKKRKSAGKYRSSEFEDSKREREGRREYKLLSTKRKKREKNSV